MAYLDIEDVAINRKLGYFTSDFRLYTVTVLLIRLIKSLTAYHYAQGKGVLWLHLEYDHCISDRDAVKQLGLRMTTTTPQSICKI